MAVLVAYGGAAVGQALFGTVGAKAGWLIGSAVGSYLLRPKLPDQEGPRLSDLSVTSSAYGSPISRLYGTMRMGGNIIWTSGIREVATTEKVGGKGASQKVTNYSYFSSFAVAFCEGETDELIRIYADSKLIYDGTGTGETTNIPGFKYRFYQGTESQNPDPLITAHLNTTIDKAPAHRGICYIMFEDLPLAEFGNRIPNITAEITKVGASTYPRDQATLPSGHTGWSSTGPVYDHVNSRVYAQTTDGTYTYLTVYSTPSMALERTVRLDQLFDEVELQTIVDARKVSGATSTSQLKNLTNLHISPFTGHGWAYIGGGGDSSPIAHLNCNSLRVTVLGKTGNPGGLDLSYTGDFNRGGPLEYDFYAAWYGYGFMGYFDEQGVTHSAVVMTGYQGSTWAVLEDESIIGIPIDGSSTNSGFGFYTRPSNYVTGKVDLNYGELYFGVTSTLGSSIYRIFKYTLGPEGSAGVILKDISASDVGVAEFDAGGSMYYDNTDDTLIINVEGRVFKYDPATDTIVWNKSDLGTVWRTVNTTEDGLIYTYIHTGGTSAHTVNLVDTSDGSILNSYTYPLSDTTGNVTSSVNFVSSDILDVKRRFLVSGDRIASFGDPLFPLIKHLGTVTGEGETLQSVLTDICEKAQLETSDLNFSDLDAATVRGYVIGRTTNARSCIQQLATAYFFDACESDYQIKFVSRGGSSVVTIDGEYLLQRDSSNGETLTETRQQDTEIPLRVSVVYPDVDREYDQGAQSKARISQPIQTMYSNKLLSVELPVAFTADEAKTIATKTLFNAWLQRSSYEFQLPKRFLKYDPTDVVTLTMPSGNQYTLRLDKFDIGTDYSVNLSAIEEDAAVYSITDTGDSGSGYVTKTIAGESPTQVVYMDIPLLRDADDTGYSTAVGYVVARPTNSLLSWSGTSVYRSSDGLLYEAVTSPTTQAGIGYTTSILGETSSPFTFDEVNTLEVYMPNSALSSVTELEMLNGANTLAVEINTIVGNSVGWEIIQFQNVVDNGGGYYTLSRLLRGRRGTEVYTNRHQYTGGLVVVVDPDTAYDFLIGSSDIGVAKIYRAVNQGQYFEDGQTKQITFSGASLKPYAPVNITADLSGSDIVIDWERRTRIGGAWKDGTGTVPLSETTEAYEVDIYDGATVVRTLTSTTSTVTYTAANITTDFGTTPTSLTLAVYQMSSTVGRGFANQTTVEVT